MADQNQYNPDKLAQDLSNANVNDQGAAFNPNAAPAFVPQGGYGQYQSYQPQGP